MGKKLSKTPLRGYMMLTSTTNIIFNKLGFVLHQIILWRLFTHLIWLTLFMTCSVTYACHRILRFPMWKFREHLLIKLNKSSQILNPNFDIFGDHLLKSYTLAVPEAENGNRSPWRSWKWGIKYVEDIFSFLKKSYNV